MADLRYAARSLGRAPTFAVTTVVTLALGIGSVVAVFTLLNAILLRPLPFRNAPRLVGAWHALPGMGFNTASQSLATYFTYKRLARTTESIAVFDRAAVNLADDRDATPERVPAARVSASFFGVLGSAFAKGRGFNESDDTPTAAPVVVLGDALWHRRFGGDPHIVGQTITVDGAPTTVVGILPAAFHYPDATTDLWLPIALDPNAASGGPFGFQAIALLRPGITIEAAEREYNRLLPRSADLFPNIAPGFPMAKFLANSRAKALLHPMRDDVVGSFGNTLWIAGAASALLLLVALVNVASLLVARAEARRRELAVRHALGAQTRQLLAAFTAEALILAFAGGVAGLLLAQGALTTLLTLAPTDLPRLSEVHIDGSVVAFTLVVSALVAALCTSIPVVRLDRLGLSTVLRDGTRSATLGRDRARARAALIVAQVAGAMVLLVGAVTALRSADALRRVNPGFDADRALTFWLSLPRRGLNNDSAVVRFTEAALAGIAQLPGVESVGMSSKIPLFDPGKTYTPIWADNSPVTDNLPQSQQLTTVAGAYFRALRIPLIAGRVFEPPARQGAYEVIIDQGLAKEYWNDSTGRAALGHRLRFTADLWYTVVGVVGSVRDTSLMAAPSGTIYLPNVVAPDSNNSAVTRLFGVTVRTSGDPLALRPAIQGVISSFDKTLPVFRVASMREVVDRSISRLSFVVLILCLVASAASMLAAVALYGVLAYVVSLRTREIGIRAALGASASRLSRDVLLQAVTLALCGIALGLGAAVPAARLLRARVPGVQGMDAVTLCIVASLLLLTATLAGWVPARRATRISPLLALQAD